LVEAYFAAHPQFAKAMRAAQMNSVSIPPTGSANGGKVAIRRIRSHLRWRAGLMAIALFCSIAPFSFIFENDHVRYAMLRDSPATALAFAGAAAIAWIAMIALGRRTETA
jgi:hypothetical protein